MKKIKEKTNWDEERGIFSTIVYYENQPFIGRAYCNPKDEDMKSKHTGYEISSMRANLKICKYLKNKTINEYNALVHLSNTISKRAKEGEFGYYLTRAVAEKAIDIEDYNTAIEVISKSLKDFIDKKERAYQIIRMNRNCGSNSYEAAEKKAEDMINFKQTIDADKNIEQ